MQTDSTGSRMNRSERHPARNPTSAAPAQESRRTADRMTITPTGSHRRRSRAPHPEERPTVHGPTITPPPGIPPGRPDRTRHPDRLTLTGSRSPATYRSGSPNGSRTDPGQKDSTRSQGSQSKDGRPRPDGHRLRDTRKDGPGDGHPPPVLASLTSRRRPDRPQRRKAGRAPMDGQTDTRHRHGITGRAPPPRFMETRSGTRQNGPVSLLTA